MNAFFTDLENIGKHIFAGIKAAAPIVQKLAPALVAVPIVGPAISEVATVITNLENAGSTITTAEIEQLITTLVAASQIKTASAVAAAPTA